ncbi:other/FunK1 protein kinase [Coprinopsis cinerea okayama7|uniref:Other/FunK1 protein kinase n=1 Tax=Coprinopsis cinerea (strain Okayama-7 / 130 / ATCC MYA-4618 / FGSC 9003) TaxID=240176 RepID=A8PES4_COPC7|nr:other/FunK1 protein kinase [Coprinopsis cinerea okayama7\|eukprot:XP_001840834.2 other/FunK1 protein kinase [Coprinopsis cinerea okayama7\
MIKNDDTRIRRRIVLKERCTTFYEVPNLKIACKIGKDIVKGLNLLREAGIIHRDISASNCLIYFDEERESHCGKITDLDYCKEYLKIGAHDPISGTKDFMAVEVEKGSFIGRAHRSEAPKLVFHRHYLHDLESLYWLMVWCAFVLVPVDIQQVDVEMWEKAFFQLFPFEAPVKSVSGKGLALAFPGDLSSSLQECGWDENTLAALDDLFNLGNDLRNEYARLQKIPQEASGGRRWAQEHFNADIYGKFSKVLDSVGSLTNSRPCGIPVGPD